MACFPCRRQDWSGPSYCRSRDLGLVHDRTLQKLAPARRRGGASKRHAPIDSLTAHAAFVTNKSRGEVECRGTWHVAILAVVVVFFLLYTDWRCHRHRHNLVSNNPSLLGFNERDVHGKYSCRGGKARNAADIIGCNCGRKAIGSLSIGTCAFVVRRFLNAFEQFVVWWYLAERFLMLPSWRDGVQV